MSTPSRIGWASLALAAAASVYAGVSLLNDSTDATGRIQERLEATPPASVQDVRELGAQVDELGHGGPPGPPPTVVVSTTAVPGPQGPAGPAGPPGRVITVFTVAPAPVTRSAQPRNARPTPSSTATPSSSSSSTPCTLAAFMAGRCTGPTPP